MEDHRRGSVEHVLTTDDGVELRVLDDGSRDAPTLLFVAGFGQGAESYRLQAEGLSDRFRIVRFDARGVGRSQKPANGYRIGRFAQDLRNVVDQLELSDVVLIAHSMGCTVALSYLESNPRGPVRALVLVDRPTSLVRIPGIRPSAPFTADAVIARAASFIGPGRRDAITDFVKSMTRPECPADELEPLVEATLSMPDDALVQLYLNSRFEAWDDLLPTIRIPTLVIGAAESMIPVGAMRHTAELIPGSRFVVLGEPGRASHFVFQDVPDAFNGLIARFSNDPSSPL